MTEEELKFIRKKSRLQSQKKRRWSKTSGSLAGQARKTDIAKGFARRKTKKISVKTAGAD
ncbi:hypothetical protein KKC32_01030 [Patescibacteria group bacterium]|nr:hypothetical protein [Patescibacteria group bacterium]